MCFPYLIYLPLVHSAISLIYLCSTTFAWSNAPIRINEMHPTHPDVLAPLTEAPPILPFLVHSLISTLIPYCVGMSSEGRLGGPLCVYKR